MKNVTKIALILLVTLMIIGISTIVMATDGIIGMVKPDTNTGTAGTVGNIGGMIVGILQVIGVAVAIIMLVMLGIKYVSAAPAEKADIKKSAAIYVVGAVLLLGATLILGWVGDFIGDLEGAGGAGGAGGTGGTGYRGGGGGGVVQERY